MRHEYLLVNTGFLFPLPFLWRIALLPTGWTPLHLDSSSPIQFNSILERRTAFRLKEFFKYLSATRVALKLRSSWIAQRQETKGNVSIKWIPVHGIRLFYTYAALIPCRITARELHAVTHVHSSSRPQRHNWSQHDAPQYQGTIWHTRMWGVTEQLADKPTRGQSSRGLVSSRTSSLAEMFDLKFAVYNSSKCCFRQITLFIRCQYSIGLELGLGFSLMYK